MIVMFGVTWVGSNDTTAKVNPVPVPELNTKGKIAKITSGSLHTLALPEDGKVYGWGANTSHESGDGSSKTIASGPGGPTM